MSGRNNKSSMGADYDFEHNNWDNRRGRFIAPTADLSALRALIDIRIILFKIIIAPHPLVDRF